VRLRRESRLRPRPKTARPDASSVYPGVSGPTGHRASREVGDEHNWASSEMYRRHRHRVNESSRRARRGPTYNIYETMQSCSEVQAAHSRAAAHTSSSPWDGGVQAGMCRYSATRDGTATPAGSIIPINFILNSSVYGITKRMSTLCAGRWGYIGPKRWTHSHACHG